MKTQTQGPRVLIATDNTTDASQIAKQLQAEFEHVQTSTNGDRAIADFEDFKPDVLVLAFDSLDKAQQYYLGLYRLSQGVHQIPHRTVILCNKDEVRAVFKLCKKQYFDDYVLYWPQTHDAPRLAMSIWTASREMTAMRSQTPSAGELWMHSRRLGELEQTIDRQFADAEKHIATAQSSTVQVERDLTRAIDAFSHRLTGDGSKGLIEVKDASAWAAEIENLKQAQLAQARSMSISSVDSMTAWTEQFKQRLEPALAGTRTLTEALRKVRPMVMVIDDDELIRKLVIHALDPQAYQTVAAADGTEALSQLRRLRPDVLLVDVRMPGLDGLSLTQRLKAAPDLSTIPVVMMTGDARRETLLNSIQAGANDFLVKPFSREALTAKLEKVLLGELHPPP
jgi:CheY-like chemotaxis protein